MAFPRPSYFLSSPCSRFNLGLDLENVIQYSAVYKSPPKNTAPRSPGNLSDCRENSESLVPTRTRRVIEYRSLGKGSVGARRFCWFCERSVESVWLRRKGRLEGKGLGREERWVKGGRDTDGSAKRREENQRWRRRKSNRGRITLNVKKEHEKPLTKKKVSNNCH